MLNKSEIMKAAWEAYRDETRFSRPTTLAGRRRLFARCLSAAWAVVKEIAREAAMTVGERAAAHVARITVAIERLQYLPFGMQVKPRRRALETELSQWKAVAAAA